MDEAEFSCQLGEAMWEEIKGLDSHVQGGAISALMAHFSYKIGAPQALATISGILMAEALHANSQAQEALVEAADDVQLIAKQMIS